jgi:hypothetical protein
MIKTLVNPLRIFICAVLTLQLVGCGTLMYPERRGQREGRIDAGVAILDGLGLLFGIIPGVIAFAVDFSNGTIYLPSRGHVIIERVSQLRQIKFDPKHTSLAMVERIIKDQTGCEVKFDQDNIKISKLKSLNDMMVQFAKVSPTIQNDRIALLKRSIS